LVLLATSALNLRFIVFGRALLFFVAGCSLAKVSPLQSLLPSRALFFVLLPHLGLGPVGDHVSARENDAAAVHWFFFVIDFSCHSEIWIFWLASHRIEIPVLRSMASSPSPILLSGCSQTSVSLSPSVVVSCSHGFACRVACQGTARDRIHFLQLDSAFQFVKAPPFYRRRFSGVANLHRSSSYVSFGLCSAVAMVILCSESDQNLGSLLCTLPV
jgi:hypothetical protein